MHLKLESLQATGSFKLRGAANKILSLAPEERARGVATCSSGNHGLAVASVASLLGIPATLCVPRWTDPVKLGSMGELGAEVLPCADTYDEAEAFCAELVEERGLTFIPPFDDPEVMAGQGTVALEILEDLPELGSVVVPLSGGGLVGGIALAAKAARPGVRVIAAYAERAAVMVASLEAGRPVSLPEEETLANALAGGIGLDNRHTLAAVRDGVDGFVGVGEEEIARAMAFAFSEHRLVVEGGGAVGIAALLDRRLSDLPGPVAVVVSGGNVGLDRLARIVREAGTGEPNLR